MAAMSIGAGVLGAVVALQFWRARQEGQRLVGILIPSLGVQNYWVASAVFSLVIALSLLYNQFDPLAIGLKTSPVHFLNDLSKVWYLFWPIALAGGLRILTLEERHFILRAWILAFGVLVFLGVVQYFTGWPRPQPIPGLTRFHATLFLGHHLSVASVLIFPFFAALDLSKSSQLFRLRDRTVLYLLLPLGLLCLFFTYSRTLWIATPVGLMAWLILSNRQNSLENELKAGALNSSMRVGTKTATVLGLLVAIALLGQTSLIRDRLFASIGLLERTQLWEANFEFIKLRPWLGVGLKHNQELSGYYLMEKLKSLDVFSGHAHNNLLDVVSGTGILGGLCWLAWAYWVFRILLSVRKNAHRIPQAEIAFPTGLLCAWIVFHINGLTQVNFWEAKVQHQLAWVIAWSLLWIGELEAPASEKEGSLV